MTPVPTEVPAALVVEPIAPAVPEDPDRQQYLTRCHLVDFPDARKVGRDARNS
jgi:hypothetical protein